MATENVNQTRASLRFTDPGSAGLLKALVDFAIPSLDDDELARIVGFEDDAKSMLSHLSSTAEGIGCLVAEDDGIGTGCFQNTEDVSRLLWMFANYGRQAGALMNASSAAAAALHARQLAKAVAQENTPTETFHGRG